MMNLRNTLLFFSLWITWSLFCSDLLFSCYVDDQEKSMPNYYVKKNVKKIKKEKYSNKNNKERITSEITQEPVQRKTPLPPRQRPTTGIACLPKSSVLSCLEKLNHEELRDLWQTESKSIIINDMKVSLLSTLDDKTSEELNDPTSSPLCAILDEIIQPSRNGLGRKSTSETGNYCLYRNKVLIEERPLLKVRFTKHNLTS